MFEFVFDVTFDDESIKPTMGYLREETLRQMAMWIGDAFMGSLRVQNREMIQKRVVVGWSAEQAAYSFAYSTLKPMYVSEEIVNRWVVSPNSDKQVTIRGCVATLRSMVQEWYRASFVVDGVVLVQQEVDLIVEALDVFSVRLAMSSMEGADRETTMRKYRAVERLRRQVRGDS